MAKKAKSKPAAAAPAADGKAAEDKKYGKPDSDRLGIFSEMSYISSEQYRDPRFDMLKERTHGRQFVTAPGKKGHHTKDAYFAKNESRLFENEAYNDIVKIRRRFRMEQKKLNITSAPFRPSPICPLPSGKGSVYGTFKHQYPLAEDNKPIVLRAEKPQSAPEPSKKNFVTRPPKRGSGYGYPNVTIGKDYEYVTDPYDSPVVLAKKERAEMKTKMISGKPFIPGSKRSDLFTQFVGLTSMTPEEAKKLKEQNPDKDAAKNKPALVNPPFKPASHPADCLNKYPTYEQVKAKSDEAVSPAERLEQLKAAGGRVFRPGGVMKTYPARSIIVANTPVAPPVWIRNSLKTYLSSA